MILLRIPEVRADALILRPPPVDPDEMLMDSQTYRDLEIFEGGAAASLFDLCNTTRTVGGAKVLAARMRKPWNKATKIRAVQESLEFVRAHRSAFDRLPTAMITHEVDQYLAGSLPIVTSEGGIGFLIEAFAVRFGDFRPYAQIVRGVQLTSKVIRALRGLIRHPALPATEGKGDIEPLLTELVGLVEQPAFAVVTDSEDWSQSALKVMVCDRTFRRRERIAVQRMLQLIYEIDALVAMSDAVDRCGWVVPEVGTGPLQVIGEGVFHPFIERPIENPVHLDDGRHMLFLTGPNMAGKTTYLRACGIAIYLAHLGMGVPARSLRFSPCERLFSSIVVTDDVRGGVSYFRAEALRVKAIAQAVSDGLRVIALMDEPFKGTNVKDAVDASQAVLQGLIGRPGNLFMISSHLIELGDEMLASARVDCRRFEASEQDARLHFDYVLRPGVSSQRLGMRVLLEEGIFSLLRTRGVEG